jgi:CBS domain-containing protein
VATTVADVMTANPGTIDRQDSARDAARLMAGNDAGDVIVTDNGTLFGIVTDRDIAVRLVAQDKPASTPVAEIISDSAIETVEPGTLLDDAIEVMRARSVRRLPVVQDGRPVGVVSLGDLAIERDPGSALADVSAAKGNK